VAAAGLVEPVLGVAVFGRESAVVVFGRESAVVVFDREPVVVFDRVVAAVFDRALAVSVDLALDAGAFAGVFEEPRLGAGPVSPPVELSPEIPFSDVTGP
jgi:hypothetical protein